MAEKMAQTAEKSPSQHLFAAVLARVHVVCAALAAEGGWPAEVDFSRVVVEPPRDASHGDMATNAAMVLAKDARAKPRELAERIVLHRLANFVAVLRGAALLLAEGGLDPLIIERAQAKARHLHRCLPHGG